MSAKRRIREHFLPIVMRKLRRERESQSRSPLPLSTGHVISCQMVNQPRCEKNGLRGFPTRSYINWAVQPQKIARGLKFGIYEVEELYYPCSENKGADQPRGYREG